MGFKADDAVPKLEWDFTKYVAGAKGVSPEPSNMALLSFSVKMQSLGASELRTKKAQAQQEADKLTNQSPEEKAAEVKRWAAMDPEVGPAEVLAELMEFVSPKEGERIALEQAKLVAEVFDNCPSVEQIMGLPGRIRMAYIGWVAGQLMNPEFVAAGTRS
jgi:hypothetical protein